MEKQKILIDEKLDALSDEQLRELAAEKLQEWYTLNPEQLEEDWAERESTLDVPTVHYKCRSIHGRFKSDVDYSGLRDSFSELYKTHAIFKNWVEETTYLEEEEFMDDLYANEHSVIDNTQWFLSKLGLAYSKYSRKLVNWDPKGEMWGRGCDILLTFLAPYLEEGTKLVFEDLDSEDCWTYRFDGKSVEKLKGKKCIRWNINGG